METVATKADLIKVLQCHASHIKSFGVNKLSVFGSFAKDNITDKSDVDLLVDFYHDKKSFNNFIDLSFFLEKLLGRKVEIITPQSLSRHIGPSILRQAENVDWES